MNLVTLRTLSVYDLLSMKFLEMFKRSDQLSPKADALRSYRTNFEDVPDSFWSKMFEKNYFKMMGKLGLGNEPKMNRFRGYKSKK